MQAMATRRAPIALLVVVSAFAAIAPAAGFREAGAAPQRSDPIAEGLPLIFDSESIRLTVVGDTLEVRGTYFLLCRERLEEPIPLYYPFPEDSLMGGARMVTLFVRSGSRSAPALPARWEDLPHDSGVRWWIPPCQADTLVAESVYRQSISPGYARYIVTTTRAWGRPIRRARFEIRLPEGAVPVDFSFPFERREARGKVYYAYTAEEFFPDRDIVVRWKR